MNITQTKWCKLMYHLKDLTEDQLELVLEYVEDMYHRREDAYDNDHYIDKYTVGNDPVDEDGKW